MTTKRIVLVAVIFACISVVKSCKNGITAEQLQVFVVSKNHTCDVIKMREMRGEVGKKIPKKYMDNPSFLCRHMHDF